MGRPKIYDSTPISHDLWLKVTSLCALYDPKVESGIIAQVNRAVDLAMKRNEDIVSVVLLSDVLNKTGYYRSEAHNFMGHNTYTLLKRQFVRDIARSLELL